QRFCSSRNFRRIQALDVLLVIPVKLLHVELHAAGAHTTEGECYCELVERKHFFVSSGIPAQESQEIEQGGRFISCGAVVANRYGNAGPLGVALRQFASRRAQDERQVGHGGRIPTEEAVE